MNYIQIEIGGELRGFKFGLGFLGELLSGLDIGIEDLQRELNKNPFKVIPQIIYHSAKYNLERQGKQPNFDRFEVSDWIEQEGGFDSEKVLSLLSMFSMSMTKDTPEVKGDGSKKK